MIPEITTKAGEGIGASSTWKRSPMRPGRFVILARLLLTELGMDKAVVKKRTFNSLRRFLPTGADALELDDSIANGIGNWQDLSRGSKPGGAEEPRCPWQRDTLMTQSLQPHHTNGG